MRTHQLKVQDNAIIRHTCDCVATNTEGTPFLGNRLGESDHTGFCNGIVGLPGVTMQTSCRRDIDDAPVLLLALVFDAEIWGCLADNSMVGLISQIKANIQASTYRKGATL